MDKKSLALTVAVTEAKAALAVAKTDDDAAKCTTVLAAALEAKVKYSKRTRTDELEEDDGAADSSDEAPETSKSPSSSGPKSSAAESAEGDDDADAAVSSSGGAEEDDAKKMKSKAVKALRGRPTTAAAVYDAIVSLTGKVDLNEALGALAGIKSQLGDVAEIQKRLAKIESTSCKDKVDAMLAAACTEGRITVPQKTHLAAQGMKDRKWLKGYLASLPKGKIVRTVEDGALEAKESTQTTELALESMSATERQIYETAARAVNMPVADYMKHAAATALKMAPRAPRH